MIKYYTCRVGSLNKKSNFYKTFHLPIVQKKYKNIRWGLTDKAISEKRITSINEYIRKGNLIYVILFPNKPNNHPYAICKLKEIYERVTGPLISIDETDEERGWTNKTQNKDNYFKYDLIFTKIYLLKKKSFGEIKLKGQCTFQQLQQKLKNKELLQQIEKELYYIKLYVKPIIC